MVAVAYFLPQSSPMGIDWLFFACVLLVCGAVLQFDRLPSRRRLLVAALLVLALATATTQAVSYRSIRCDAIGDTWYAWFYGC